MCTIKLKTWEATSRSSSSRQLFACIAVPMTCGIRQDDVFYCYLPLYHSSGGQLGSGAALFGGTTTIIKKKFSASAFWKDCVKHNVTVRE